MRGNLDRYLELLKRTVCGMTFEDPSIPVPWRQLSVYSETTRENGRDWPMYSHTMIGLKRLDNLQMCIEQVIEDRIRGDLIECGVWRGGACIFMRGVLSAHNVLGRTVWLADSFDGFPPTSISEGDRALIAQPEQAHLAVPLDEVRHNFELYGLLDDQVGVIPGWFKDSLPGPVKKLAVLRLDADLYVSTMDALDKLYPLLQPGGFCIIDDWNVPMCREAVMEYRQKMHITEPYIDIDGHSVYWRRDG
jgi:hypothetical protein